jgi:hypothetical protein
VGFFNAHAGAGTPPYSSTLCPSEIPGLPWSERFVVHYRDARQNTRWVDASGPTQHTSVTLGAGEWVIATVVPIERGLAIVGLIDKMNPAAAVRRIHNLGRAIRIDLRDAGTLGLWCERPVRLEFQGQPLAAQQNGTWVTAEIPAAGSVMLS